MKKPRISSVSHLIFDSERAVCFHACAITFCLIESHIRKSQKKTENNLDLLYINVSFFSIRRHFNNKVVKSIQICLKWSTQ